MSHMPNLFKNFENTPFEIVLVRMSLGNSTIFPSNFSLMKNLSISTCFVLRIIIFILRIIIFLILITLNIIKIKIFIVQIIIF
jgi:hypothetical protein